MDHWQLPYLGMRQIPNELNEFELNTFFTFSSKLVISGCKPVFWKVICRRLPKAAMWP